MLPTPGFRPTRSDWLHAAMVGALLFALYAATSSRTVEMEDDGLFILSSYFLGVEHPPGYPLFTLIGHLFSRLPLGSVAYRVHLASAFFGALTCAAAWLCTRCLVAGRLPAYLAGFGLGLSPVFWSQSIIAEVYSLNTFFFVVLIYLGLRACPPSGQAEAAREQPALLALMAFLFGLSLSNHYPLMLLVAPAFGILLWPARMALLNRLGVLSWLVIAGLLPYVWMVRRSWMEPPISFDGPLQTIQEIWFFVSRAGYENVDQSASASWLDQIKFFRFLGGEVLAQFALLGTLLAAAGVAAQRRVWGNRVAFFLAVAFLMPSVVLLLLLGFDYDSVGKHVFHVYPLPAYAVLALWMGLGFAWLTQRYRLSGARATAACAALLAIIAMMGARTNIFTDHGWGARHAQAILRVLPKDAVLFVTGESDLGPLAYFYLVEQARPDIELYQSRGLVLGNRLFHPLRTSEEQKLLRLRDFVDKHPPPIAYTAEFLGGYGRRDHWLYVEIDKTAPADAISVDVPDAALPFFEESVLMESESNAWVAYQQDELRRRFAVVLGQRLRRGQPLDPRESKYLAILSRNFYGALGLAEGLMKSKEQYAAGPVIDALDRARDLMPADLNKAYQSRFFYLRGVLRLDLGDRRGATQDLETSFSIWPVADNPVLTPLRETYAASGDGKALQELEARVRTIKKKH